MADAEAGVAGLAAGAEAGLAVSVMGCAHSAVTAIQCWYDEQSLQKEPVFSDRQFVFAATVSSFWECMNQDLC